MNAGLFLSMKHNKLTLSLAEACEELGMAVGTAHNKISTGNFPIPSRIQGKNRVIDIRDLGEYIDRERENARRAFGIK